MSAVEGDKPLVSRKAIEAWFYVQLVGNGIVLCAVIALLIYSISAANDANERQLAAIQQQNVTQICVQRDITIAVRKIGRSLGLPVEGIRLPTVEEDECP